MNENSTSSKMSVALQTLLAWLNALLGLVPAGTALWTALTTRRTLADQINSEGREPTPEEWAQLDIDVAAKEAMIDQLSLGR